MNTKTRKTGTLTVPISERLLSRLRARRYYGGRTNTISAIVEEALSAHLNDIDDLYPPPPPLGRAPKLAEAEAWRKKILAAKRAGMRAEAASLSVDR